MGDEGKRDSYSFGGDTILENEELRVLKQIKKYILLL